VKGRKYRKAENKDHQKTKFKMGDRLQRILARQQERERQMRERDLLKMQPPQTQPTPQSTVPADLRHNLGLELFSTEGSTFSNAGSAKLCRRCKHETVSSFPINRRAALHCTS
jgi:hypothetical protein